MGHWLKTGSLKSLLLKTNGSVPVIRPGSVYQVRGICHKDHMDPEVVASKSKPWNYEKKKYSYWHQYLLKVDKCVQRWDENTKIIIVDGPVAVGKTKFATELADQLGMRHIKEPTFDQIYINQQGFDYRTLNWRLPAAVQYVDTKMALMNPFHPNIYTYILCQYRARYAQYLEALVHLFNTGQGVVMERCPQGDFVWAKALNKCGFLPDDAVEYHRHIRKETIWELKRPHLLIWLDIPPEESLKRVRKRNIDYEVNSKVMNLEYLEALDYYNKEQFLPEISKHAELLIYDWTEGQETDLVVEDLEKLDFDQYDRPNERMEDWRHYHHTDFDNWRRQYSNSPWLMWRHFNQPDYAFPSVRQSQDELSLLSDVQDSYGPEYDRGYEPSKHPWYRLIFKWERQNYRQYEADSMPWLGWLVAHPNTKW